ncbi:MAG TPA: type II secretion system protein GspE [Planctomycetes bacterium]|nr:type II secretion system protein GspE [Planctomycetota bacterium]
MIEAVLHRLIDANRLSPEAAEAVRAEQHKTGKPLAVVLTHAGHVPEEAVLDAMAAHLGIPMLTDLEGARVNVQFIEKVPIEFARHHAVVALNGANGALLIATADPLDTYPLDEVGMLLGREIAPVVAPREKILSLVSNAYEMDLSAVDSMLGGLDSASLEGITREIAESEDLADMANKAPIVKLLNTILFQALKQRASDVHIQPYERHVQARYRIDGILYDVMRIPKVVQEAVISRIKVMGKMDIAERRVPQDGQTSFVAGGREVDVRISTIPSVNGERAVMRLQDKSTGIYDLRKIGLLERDLETMTRLIAMAHGIILVTGPTGSGKTTTLYAALKEINGPEVNIITIEDPVEYQLPGISQVQVSNKKGMTFATGLRSIVRQDPDVIMVGEIRDLETAGIAIQSALTGHLVFSTLHTNDASGAVSRLLDLGCEPFLVNSALIAVAAQRLVRRVCLACREAYAPAGEELAANDLARAQLKDGLLYRARGCPACQSTGYMGRMGIYEILQIDDAVKDEITRRESSAAIKKNAIERGRLATLRQDGMAKAALGLTTIDEVRRVTQLDIA